ncbi:MAG TPA: hypothetical protein GX515_01835 [Firmicutes bacterium]|nr:hypothetical protein [Bacillota bacterium]
MENGVTIGYDLNVHDAGLIPLVIVIVQYLKRYVDKRWVPLLPFPVSAALSALVVIGSAGEWPGWPAFLAQTAVETLKVAFAAMGLFKIYWTTVLGN